jgi:CcmD family protein
MLAITPALPLHEAGKYVAGAYIVAFVLVLVYVAIMALRLARVERELGELLSLSEQPAEREPLDQDVAARRRSPVGASSE